MKRSSLAALAAVLGLAGCGVESRPELAGQPGLVWEAQRFYLDHASEKYGRCPRPRMLTITQSEVVEETEEKVVMRLRYRWIDEGQSRSFDPLDIVMPNDCSGFASRDFTLARMSDGTLSVTGMSGETRNVRQNFNTGTRNPS